MTRLPSGRFFAVFPKSDVMPAKLIGSCARYMLTHSFGVYTSKTFVFSTCAQL